MAVKLLLLAVVASLTTQTSAQRIWLIQVGHEFVTHTYFDDAGYLKGFAIQLIDLVCAQANQDCRMIWDKVGNCWKGDTPGEQGHGGVGLLAGWYDACMSWTPTTERVHVFQFGLQYTKPRTSLFFTKKGNPGRFSPFDLRGKTIGFISGGGASPQCIARRPSIQGHILSPENIKIYSLTADLFDALQSGEVDATFAVEDFFTVDHHEELQRFEDKFFCYLGGKSVMTRKDNEFVQHWNTGLQKLKQTNKWGAFCEATNAEHDHQGTVNCSD